MALGSNLEQHSASMSSALWPRMSSLRCPFHLKKSSMQLCRTLRTHSRHGKMYPFPNEFATCSNTRPSWKSTLMTWLLSWPRNMESHWLTLPAMSSVDTSVLSTLVASLLLARVRLRRVLLVASIFTLTGYLWVSWEESAPTTSLLWSLFGCTLLLSLSETLTFSSHQRE